MKHSRNIAKRRQTGFKEPTDIDLSVLSTQISQIQSQVSLLEGEVARLVQVCESINHITSQLGGLHHRLESFDWVKHRIENIERYIGESAEKAMEASHNSTIDASTALSLVVALERQVDRLLTTQE